MRQTAFDYHHILGDLVASEVHHQFSGCRLCWSISQQARRFPENTLLLETDDFVVTPALGSLHPSNLLFVAKQHIRALGTWTADRAADAEAQLHEVLRTLEPVSQSWLTFEHGASQQCRTRACCIDHFHMHLIPVEQTVAERLVGSLPTGSEQIEGFGAIPDRIKGIPESYISLQLPDGTTRISLATSFPSQFIRQQLATMNGIGAEWNWRSHPREMVAGRTVASLKRKSIAPIQIYFAHAIEERERTDIEAEIANARFRLEDAGVNVLVASMYEALEEVFDEDLPLDGANKDELLVQCELQFLRASDLLVVDLRNPDWQYVGCLMEIVYAHQAGIPVLAVTGESTIAERLWLRTHVTACVPDFDNVIEWVRDNEATLRGTGPTNVSSTSFAAQ